MYVNVLAVLSYLKKGIPIDRLSAQPVYKNM